MLQLKFISKRQRKSNTRKTKSKLTNKLIKIIFIRADPLSFKITYSGGLWNNWYLFMFSPWCYWRLNDPLRYLIQSILAFVFLFCFVLFYFIFFMKTTKYSVLIAVFLSSVDGGFSLWSTWTTCSATCGTGTQSRNRTCTNPVPASNGLNCTGDYSEATSCKIASCPGK